MKVEKFRELVEKHDLTYNYSDDHRAYSNGERQYKEIMELSKEIPIEEAKAIWNANVEKKMRKEVWSEFKWI